MLLAAEYSVLYITTSEFIEMNKRSNNFLEVSDFYENINRIRNVEYLLLDNFGWNAGIESELRIITDLLRYRYDNDKPTIICSNINLIKVISEPNGIKPELLDYYRQTADYINDSSRYTIINIKNGISLRGQPDGKVFDIKKSLLSKLSFYKDDDITPSIKKVSKKEIGAILASIPKALQKASG